MGVRRRELALLISSSPVDNVTVSEVGLVLS